MALLRIDAGASILGDPDGGASRIDAGASMGGDPDGGASEDSGAGGCPGTTTAGTGGSGCGTEEMGPVRRTLRGMGEASKSVKKRSPSGSRPRF